MEYSAELTPAERQILVSLIGKHINSVQDPDGPYSIRVCCEGCITDFTPEDIATPEDEKPAAVVTRPHITNDQSELRQNIAWRVLFRNVGVITRILVLHTVTTFTPLRATTNVDVAMLLVSAGEEYGIRLHHPNEPMLDHVRQLGRYAVVQIDIGIALFTDTGQVLTIRTDGLTYFVTSVLQRGIPEDMQPYVLMHAVEYHE